MSKSIKLSNKLTNKYGAYPTGRHVVVRKDALNVNADKVFMEISDFNSIFGEYIK